MTQEKEEFKRRMEAQLSELHRRIVELEGLRPHSQEHTISWDTVVGECRKKHVATVRRLRGIDDHADAGWHAERQHVEADVEALRDALEKHEKAAG